MTKCTVPTRARSYRLEVELIDRIGQLAAQYDVNPSPLVNGLLRYALTELDTARATVERLPVTFTVCIDRNE